MLKFLTGFFVAAMVLLATNSFARDYSMTSPYTPCWQFSSEAECQGAGCSWDPGKQMCMGGSFSAYAQDCRKITCPCKCLPSIGCQWDSVHRLCTAIN